MGLEFIISDGNKFNNTIGYGCASNISYEPYMDMDLDDENMPVPYKFYSWHKDNETDYHKDKENFP